MENQAKKTGKKEWLIIGISAAVLVVIGVIIYFIMSGISTTNHDYTPINSAKIAGKNTFSVILQSPYSKDGIEYEIADPKGVSFADKTTLSSTDKFEAVISDVSYTAEKNVSVKSGFTEITIQLGKDFSFNTETVYQLIISDGAVREKGGKQLKGLSYAFSCMQMGTSFMVFPKEIKPYDTSELSNVEFSIKASDNDYYIEALVNTSELVNLNSEGLNNEETGILMTYKNEKDTVVVRRFCENIEMSRSADGQKLTLKVKIKDKKDVSSGTEYFFYLQEALLMNGDGKLVNAQYTDSYSFVG